MAHDLAANYVEMHGSAKARQKADTLDGKSDQASKAMAQALRRAAGSEAPRTSGSGDWSKVRDLAGKNSGKVTSESADAVEVEFPVYTRAAGFYDAAVSAGMKVEFVNPNRIGVSNKVRVSKAGKA